jgi:hypothetical protein
MRQVRSRIRWGVVVAIAAAVVAATVVAPAFAYWSSAGNGMSATSAATSQAVVLGVGSPTAQLYPGGASDVALTISNPNLFPVHVGTVSLDTTSGTAGYAIDGAHTGCALTVLGFQSQTNGGSGWTVPKKVGTTNGTLPLDLAGALTMTTDAASACQGGTVAVYLTAGP